MALPRWNLHLFSTTSAVAVDGRVATRRNDVGVRGGSATKATVGTDARFEVEGVHRLIVALHSCPADHPSDPLEMGVLVPGPAGSFHGVGYATEGRLRGGAIFKDGRSILPAPAVSPGATLGVEVTISRSGGGGGGGRSSSGRRFATVRFQVNGHYVSRPVRVGPSGDGTFPLAVVPVFSLPVGAEVSNQAPASFSSRLAYALICLPRVPRLVAAAAPAAL